MKTLTAVIISFILTMFGINVSNSSDTVSELKVRIESLSEPLTDTSEFNPENLKRALKLYGIKNPDIVFKQAILETGSFTSDIFKENNNLFGMKHPYVRTTTSLGSNRGHALYFNWLDSVRDMAHFQDYYWYRIEHMHKDDYYSFLDDVYATDRWYVNKLKNILNV